MLLSIAIISLVSFIISIGIDMWLKPAPSLHLGIITITVLSWWTICFSLAIVLLVIGSLWLIVCIAHHYF